MPIYEASSSSGLTSVVTGADLTGSTDSTLAVQAAINALGTTGGTVTGPPGTYLLSKQGTSSHDSINPGYCLRLADARTCGPIVLDFPSGTTFKLADGQDNSSILLLVDGQAANRRTGPTIIRGITFDGNRANQTPPWTDFGLISTFYADDTHIEDCTFKNDNLFSIHIHRDSRGTVIERCFFDATGISSSGASLRAETTDVLIQSNRFLCDAVNGRQHLTLGTNADVYNLSQSIRVFNNSFAGGYNGYAVALNSYCQIVNNLFRDVCHTSGWALQIADYSNTNGTIWEGAFNVIKDNVFFNVRQGIQMTSDASSITANSTTRKWTFGALLCVIANNILTQDPVDLRTVIGLATTYPARFSPTPNVTSIGLATGIQINSDTKLTTTAVASATANTLTVAGTPWASNAYQYYIVSIVSGTGRGQARKINSNTNNTLTVNADWDVTPDSTSSFVIAALIGYNKVFGNIVHAAGGTTKAFNDESWLPNEWFDNTSFNSSTGAVAYTINNPLARMRGNKAWNGSVLDDNMAAHVMYQDENSGTATIASGATSVAVTHKLGRTPSAEQIRLTPTNNPTNDPGNLYISAVSSTTFTVSCRADPGAGGATFAWRANGLNA